MKASSLKPGKPARILKIIVDGKFSRRLTELGFVPGTIISVIGTTVFGDPISIKIDDVTMAMRKKAADLIEVEYV